MIRVGIVFCNSIPAISDVVGTHGYLRRYQSPGALLIKNSKNSKSKSQWELNTRMAPTTEITPAYPYTSLLILDANSFGPLVGGNRYLH